MKPLTFSREFEVAKLRVAGAAERVRRLREIVAKLEEDPMLLSLQKSEQGKLFQGQT